MECARIISDFDTHNFQTVRVTKLRSWGDVEQIMKSYPVGSVKVVALRGPEPKRASGEFAHLKERGGGKGT